jgi:CHASE3 domain sensor protein
MKQIQKTQPLSVSKIEKKEKNEKSTSEMQKKDKLLSAGVYALIIVVTIALMLILFNLFIKG